MLLNEEKILWIDLEMTGIDPDKDRILEVAAIITDWDFNEIATFESSVKVSEELIDDRMNSKFWLEHAQTRDFLKLQSLNSEFDSSQVESRLIDFLNIHFSESLKNGERILLAGNSIHQDRRFIRSEWKDLEKLLHYRMLDVSAWKVVMKSKFKRIWASGEEHRALDDIRGSIEELKFYLKKIKR